MGRARRVGFAPPIIHGGASPTLPFVIAVFLLIGINPILGDELLDGFLSPPDTARPWTYWFVMDGNLNREGITADFEAIHDVGMRGVLFMEVDVGIPKGPVKFMSRPWRELFKHANEEAARLGLVMTMPASPGWTGSGGPWVKPEQSMQKLVFSELNVTGPQRFEGPIPTPETVEGFYRDVAVLAFPTPSEPYQIEDIDEKAVHHRGWYTSQPGVKSLLPLPETYPSLSPDQIIAINKIVNLTDKLNDSGRLIWDVPPGPWTVLRFGHTSTGATTRPAPEPGLGLECDKFDKAALKAHFDEFLGKLMSDIGPLTGKSLTSLHIDSWEMGPQNWTASFPDEFKRRRGYDLLLYLPAMTGRVVQDLETSERFLWDVRQTIQELIVENHARYLAELAHEHGLGLSIEPYDQTPCDDMAYGACADVPMCEFWRDTFQSWFSCHEASSIAHTYGKQIVQAEAFTSGSGERWLAHPASLKALGDWAFCNGINRFVFHRYAHQPWLDRFPGMTMGPYGIHYERTQTWWEMSRAWIDYLSRCQFMLQQGLFVADVCFLKPEDSPQVFRPPSSATQGEPPDRLGYNFDGCTPEVLLTRMSVKDGRLVLPDGMSYRVLVLPELRTMTPKLLRKVKDLVAAGATIIGPRPLSSPSLNNYPACDEEVIQLADDLWGHCDGVTVTEHTYGKGRIVWRQGEPKDVPHRPKDPLKDAKWIWENQGHPAQSAPVGKRVFHHEISLPVDTKIKSAHAYFTADNDFELFIHDQSVGTGNNFHQVYEFDVTEWIQPGVNSIRVTAINGGEAPNPAGLIGTLLIAFDDGRVLEIATDSKWKMADDSSVVELGPVGMAPWGQVTIPVPRPEYYCDYNIVADVLSKMNVPPDFESDGAFRYVHRCVEETDLYFVANYADRWQCAECAFRVTGKTPEIWDPITGQIEQPAVYHQKDGRTYLPLSLEPNGSRFIVFRTGVRSPSIVTVSRNGQSLLPVSPRVIEESPAAEVSIAEDGKLKMLVRKPGRYKVKGTETDIETIPAPTNIPGPWKILFQPGRGAPEVIELDQLIDLSTHQDSGVKYFSGVATYRTTFDWSLDDASSRFYLNLGQVQVMAQVSLNGHDLGILWKPPYEIDVTDALKPRQNTLEINVANLWPNRLIGDKILPAEQRVAWTTWNPFEPDASLPKSGLIGPVTLYTAVELALK